MKGFLETNARGLEAFAKMSNIIGSRVDFVQGGGGNTSVKLEDGLMAIKASGYKLSDVKIDDGYAVLGGKDIRAFFNACETGQFYDIEAAGSDFVKGHIVEVEGLKKLRPSVEAGFHSLLGRFVIHSHSVYANLAACANNCEEIIEKAMGGAPYSWGIVDYTDPGARLTIAIRDEIKRVSDKTGSPPAAIFMKNHGLIAHHDDSSMALEIHTDANDRIAGAFGIGADSFPQVELTPCGEGKYASNTAYLRQALKSGMYGEEFLLCQPLYPDQIVFLSDTLGFSGEPGEGQCVLDEKTGIVTYNMPLSKALVLEETLTAVIFIAQTIHENGYTPTIMDEAAKAFISNWESEKYRKSLSGS